MTRPDLHRLVDRIPESVLHDGAHRAAPDDLWALGGVIAELTVWSADVWHEWIT